MYVKDLTWNDQLWDLEGWRKEFLTDRSTGCRGTRVSQLYFKSSYLEPNAKPYPLGSSRYLGPPIP